MHSMNDPLAHIINRADTWRGLDASTNMARLYTSANSDWHNTSTVTTGFNELDDKLQLGGWPLSGSIEILSDGSGMGSMGLFLPMMKQLSRQGRWQVFIAPPQTPYAPLLAAKGIDIQQILMVHPKNREELLWATEQALRSTTCSAVFSWLGAAEYRYAELRKLQLAAATNDTLALLFRPNQAANQHTPASLRLAVSGYRRVDILKQRGGSQVSNIILHSDNDIPEEPQLWELPHTKASPFTQNQLAPAG